MYGQTNGIRGVDEPVSTTRTFDDGYITYTKLGNTVSVSLTYKNNTTTAQWVTVATLPVGYRPPDNVYFCGYNNSATATTQTQALESLRIDRGGNVQWWPYFQNHQCVASATFIADR